jgi:hypothetical protein
VLEQEHSFIIGDSVSSVDGESQIRVTGGEELHALPKVKDSNLRNNCLTEVDVIDVVAGFL